MACHKTDGPEGYIARVLLDDGTPMMCKLKKCGPGDIKVCINCSLVQWDLYNLRCSHKLCDECFWANKTYICPMDNTKTEKFEVVPLTSLNTGLLKTILECPSCGIYEKYSKFKEHVQSAHPEMSRKRTPLGQPENELSTSPATVRPPPGFEGRVRMAGRGRGVLFKKQNVFDSDCQELGYKQARNDTELPTSDVPHEDMDFEQTPQLMTQQVGNEGRQTVGGASTYVPCPYCAGPVKADDVQEHSKHCFDVFVRWKQLVCGGVFNDCRKNDHQWQSKYPQGHVYECPLLDFECKRSFIEISYNCDQEHRADQCHATKPGSSSVEEPMGICPKFSITCSEVLSRVADKYRQDHFKNGCPGAKQNIGSPEQELDQFCETPASTPDANTQQKQEETHPCPNCSAELKIEEVADHAENCPELLVCGKCSSRVVTREYETHLDDHCCRSKQSCTSSQVDGDEKTQTATKRDMRGAHQVDSADAGSTACPYCQISWDNRDLQEHVKYCQRDCLGAANVSSERMDHNSQRPMDAFLTKNKPDSTFVKKLDEDNERPKKAEDDIEVLKSRVEELEKRIENIERPLRRLIQRLRTNE